MGDERLLIDRYDGRGHLYDLTKHDADVCKKRPTEVSEEEQAIEAACDEERYLELVTDVQEKALYEEEEWKRYYESLQEGSYKAVGFSYEQPTSADAQKEAEAEELDELFVPPEELMIPGGILVPQTEKLHARMEKTATFIAQHGIQMEIMIKTKQARNAQFEFLSFENPLNAYYKHLVQIIKSGKYKPKQQEQPTPQEPDYGDQHYLHPSLSTASTHTPLPPPPPLKKIELPKVNVHDTHYGQLISSLKKYSNHKHVKEENSLGAHGVQPPSLPPFMAQPDYGGSAALDELPSSVALHRKHQVTHVHLARLKEERPEPPPPGTETVRPLTHSESLNDMQQGCEDRSSPGPQQIVPPPPDIQPIIDRMAMYVAKNGVEFEFVVKSKRDPRFAFLESGHVHFQYYDFKKNMFLKEAELKKRLEAKQAERERQKKEEEAAAAASRSISFSIKGKSKDPESTSGLVKRPLFDYDSSDGEGDEDGSRKDAMSRSSTPDSVRLRAAAIASSATAMAAVAAADTRPPLLADELEKKQAEERLKDKLAVAAREKLVASTKEKHMQLMASTKEKQMQLERKKKAALFINLLRIVKESPLPGDKPKADDNKEVAAPDMALPAEIKEQSPPSSVAVFDYNNRSGTPTRLDKGDNSRALTKSRSKSPSESRSKRKKSPTPPSAYANPHRSPPRYSPPRRRSRSPRRGIVGPRRISPYIRPCRVRRITPPPSRPKRSRSPVKKKNKRSRSGSPSSKQHKKKPKRSRSKTPKKKKKAQSRSKEKESSKHSRDRASNKQHDKKKEKEKKKEKDRKDDKKDKHKSKDKTDKEKRSKEIKSSTRKDKDDTAYLEKRQRNTFPASSLVKAKAEADISQIEEIIDSSTPESTYSSDDDVIRVRADGESQRPDGESQRPDGESQSIGASSHGEKTDTPGSLSPFVISSSSACITKSQTSVAETESMESL